MSDFTAHPQNSQPASRRNFIKGSSILLAGSALPGAVPNATRETMLENHPSHEIRVGLVGCGGRGTALATQALDASHGNVKLVAVADVFEDRIQQCMRALRSSPNRDRISVDPHQRFVGLEAFKRIMECDLDLVILATPPGFRPSHFAEAVAAGKHVFAEKPVAVDAPGIQRFLATCREAADKKLAVAVGLQRRHEPMYQQTIAKLKEGAIGRINFCRAYWNQGTSWTRPRTTQQTELEFQLRNWIYFNWLSGDQIVEQHVHNLDVINWLLGEHPDRAQGTGGRQSRTESEFGQVYDHHVVEYTYPSGVKLMSMCRQMANCWNAVGEFAHGAEGWADISAGKLYDGANRLIWQSDIPRYGHSCELRNLFAALGSGEVPNEGISAAESTMTAIMGRMATYSGKEVTWANCFNSPIALANTDIIRSLRDKAPCQAENGKYPVARPGDELTKVG